MILVMKSLKILALPFKGCIAGKPLATEELTVIRSIKVFHHSVAPRLANGDKNRLNATMKT